MTPYQLRSHLDALDVSVYAFADACGVSPRTVYRWIKEGAEVPRLAELVARDMLAQRGAGVILTAEIPRHG